MRPRIEEWEAEIETEIKAEYGRLGPRLIDDFKRFAPPVPDEIGCINFEIHSRFGGFPVICHALDKEGINQVRPDPGAPWESYLLSEFDDDLLPDELVEEHDISYEIAAIFLAEFIGECWQKAIGSDYPIAVFANHHDRQSRFDCLANAWR